MNEGLLPEPRLTAKHLAALAGSVDIDTGPDLAAQGIIYFITAGEGRPIKIGFSTNVQQRLESLQTGNHEQLVLLAEITGSKRDEILIHRAFASDRVRGEWFARSTTLELLISATKSWRTSYRSERGVKIPLIEWLDSKINASPDIAQ